MSKLIILLSVLFSVLTGRSAERKFVEAQVVKDVYSKHVAPGKCRIVGVVYHMGEFYKGADVCAYSGSGCTKSVKYGTFSLEVDTSEIAIYATIKGVNTSYLEGYKFQSQHQVEVKFYIQDKSQYTPVRKPVIYLYSDVSRELNLTLNSTSELAFTYPTYENGWNFKVDKNGIHFGDRDYPYLFWEGKDYGNLRYKIIEGKISGQMVQTDTIVEHLETYLTVLGLNDIEKTDFITFWAPILQTKRYAFIQFLVDEDYNQIATFNCSEKIDHLRRLFMNYELFDSYVSVHCTNSHPAPLMLVRTGLTLVEWGGAQVDVPEI